MTRKAVIQTFIGLTIFGIQVTLLVLKLATEAKISWGLTLLPFFCCLPVFAWKAAKHWIKIHDAYINNERLKNKICITQEYFKK